MRFGTNWGNLHLGSGVAPYQVPGMIALATTEPIDWVLETYGVQKMHKDKIHAYMGKWIYKDEVAIQIIDEYFEFKLQMPLPWGAAAYFERSDFEPEVKVDPADKRLQDELDRKAKIKQEQERQIASGELNAFDALIAQSPLLQALFPNWLPNAEATQAILAQANSKKETKVDGAKESEQKKPARKAPAKKPVKKATRVLPAKKKKGEDRIGAWQYPDSATTARASRNGVRANDGWNNNTEWEW